MTDLNDIDKIDLKPYGRLNNKSKDDAVFIKQTPVHPRDRLKKLAAEGEEVKFIKQVPVHPTDRLKRKRKGELVNYNRLNKKSKGDVVFIKQVPVHPRDRLKKKADNKLKHPKNRMKNKEGQIGRDNFSKLMRDEFDFSTKKY